MFRSVNRKIQRAVELVSKAQISHRVIFLFYCINLFTYAHMHMCACMWVGGMEPTTFGSWFFLSISCVPGIELRSTR